MKPILYCEPGITTNHKFKQCFCIGPDKCKDENCHVVKEYKKMKECLTRY